MSELTAAELDDFNEIISDTLDRLIIYADEHNIDRDNFIEYFCGIFSTMASISTFKTYRVKGGDQSEAH